MYSIGVDFHKAYSHMTVLDAQGVVLKAGKVPNTADAVRAFVAPYRVGGEAVIEATRNWTVMYDLLETELQAVHLAHPLKVRAIAEARIKTDRIDSRSWRTCCGVTCCRPRMCDRESSGSASKSSVTGCS